jgi:hypothetical protein
MADVEPVAHGRKDQQVTRIYGLRAMAAHIGISRQHFDRLTDPPRSYFNLQADSAGWWTLPNSLAWGWVTYQLAKQPARGRPENLIRWVKPTDVTGGTSVVNTVGEFLPD